MVSKEKERGRLKVGVLKRYSNSFRGTVWPFIRGNIWGGEVKVLFLKTHAHNTLAVSKTGLLYRRKCSKKLGVVSLGEARKLGLHVWVFLFFLFFLAHQSPIWKQQRYFLLSLSRTFKKSQTSLKWKSKAIITHITQRFFS